MTVRRARKQDAQQFFGLVRALAEFERLEGPDMEAQKRLIKDGLVDKQFNILLAFEGKRAIGYAVYFFTYSTFLARPTLYLEDIFILKEHRKKGVGKGLFLACVKEAASKQCGRMEFAVLEWNKSAIDFYERLGARRLREWSYYRLEGKDLRKLTKE